MSGGMKYTGIGALPGLAEPAPHIGSVDRIVQVGALLLVTLGLVAVTGGAASAHTASVSATCKKLSVNLTSYQSSGGQNRVQVSVDGASRADAQFGTSYSQTFPFSDETVAHTWTVKVTAWDDPNGQKGWTFTKSGTSDPCQPPDACPDLPGTQPPGTMCTPPHKDYEKREIRATPDCYDKTVTVEKRSGPATTPGTATPGSPAPGASGPPTTPTRSPRLLRTAPAPR